MPTLPTLHCTVRTKYCRVNALDVIDVKCEMWLDTWIFSEMRFEWDALDRFGRFRVGNFDLMGCQEVRHVQ